MVNQTNSKLISATDVKWYALRDLRRPNAKYRAWEMFDDLHLTSFTPKKYVLTTIKGARYPKEVALIPDLLFVRDTKQTLDPIIEANDTLQYRFRKYGSQNEPITVPDADMERFICAVNATETPQFYRPEEITAAMQGRRIRIVGGPLDGYEGSLITTRGSKVKRLLVELKGFLAVGIEVNPEYIQLIH